MRYIIFILLLSIEANSQIVINRASALASQTTNATSFSLGPATFTAGRLYLFIAQTTGTTNPGTISSTTLTWTSVASVGNSTNRIQVFRCVPGSTAIGETVTLGTFGGGSTGYSVAYYEITGVVTTGTNGADAIVQAVTQAATTGTDPTINLAAISGNRNAVIGWFSNDANPFGGAEESGWTEIFDSGYSTPTTGMYETARNPTNDNSVVVTAASSTWIGIAIELKAATNSGFFKLF